ncbi:Ig-like domain-containing protein [Bifidobacterium sp. ESL0763]|nr:Ig-like domain-containing protein [Bifidobacterium sp. ESL0763]MDF7664286.1 Ig-like domain-containing protein [Bifidobacterium sp. ESL0763]
MAFKRLNSQTNRRWLTPVVMLLVLLAIVAGAIIVNTVTRAHVHLDDGTVWVTSLKDRKAARFNVRLKQANGAVSPTTPSFDVAQHDDDTILSDGTKAQGIQAATLGIHGKSDTKSSTKALVGGGSAAFLNSRTGNVWTGKASDLDSIAPTTSAPQMRLGEGGKVAVTHDGAIYGYRPSDGMVFKMDNEHARAEQLKSLTDGQHTNADSFTVIGDRPVIATGHTLVFKGGKADLDSKGKLSLQAPPTDGNQEDWVAASASNGVFTLDFSHGNKVASYPNGGKAEPAQPVSSNGCLYAAWSQQAHNYIRLCSPAGAADATGAGKASYKTLESVSPTSQLVFRTNHRLVVLNDVVNGNVWNPDQSTKVIKIQWKQVETKKATNQRQNSDSANNQKEFKPTCSAKSGSIKAQDDQFGARVGGQQILDVLRNDEQTDCSVLHITKVGPVQGSGITVSPIYAGRYLQLDATNAKPGKTSFTYEINDGRGQSSEATVSLNIEAGAANQAPAQSDTPPEYEVEQGATITVNALGSFTDPEGDPLTLTSAVAQNNDQVAISTRADGQLVFNTGSLTGGRVGVEVTASDGRATGTGLVYFSVRPANTLPALIDAVSKTTTPDTTTTIALKQYVHGTSAQPPLLTAVNAPEGTTTSANAADLSFTFKASNPGTYYVPYTITQGSIEAQGLARVEVQPVTDQSAKPIAANDVALLGADRTAIVEPLNNDTDPMGGVLSVTSVSVDPKLGIKTGLVAHKRVYMTARQIPTKPVELSYTVANASGSSRGTIVLQPPALTTTNAAPKAANIDANVRTGGIVSVDAIDHVSHADGTTVKLQNALQYNKKTFKGLVFVSGDNVRYEASSTPGVYPVTYTVKDNVGNAASGTITITVHAKDATTKTAPTPHDTQAQVASGQKVRIPITLTGIDNDGDDDTLLGLGNKAPKLGRIDEVGANYLVYQAYADSTGTDTFSYAVEDWTGQRAQAQIRVGVYKDTSGSGVYARDDQVTLRPDTRATVPVALNDISGDSTDLTVSPKLEAQGIDGASVKDNMISLKTPSQAGTSYVIYTVHDKAGLADTGTLSVTTDPNAPIEPPTAYDYRVPSAATLDKKSVDVDLSQWIANPSGTADELQVGIDPSAQAHARVKGGAKSTTVSIDLTSEARSVPYTVTNTTYNVTSTAFVQVPAYGVFPPTLRPKAPKIKVNAKRTVTINIADYVRVGPGKTAYVDKGSVSATKSANSDYYVNDQTLKFTAPRDYAGPASITFTAMDGKKDDHAVGKVDKNGVKQAKIVNSAVLTLPITVIGRNVPPPTFSSPTINVAAGEDAKTVDLKALTHAPSGLDEDEKDYSYSGGEASGPVSAHLSAGGRLSVKAEADAPVGSISSIPITIKYSNGTVSAGLTAQVSQSTRPLAKIADVHKQIKAGSTETVNVLDGAFNPFPGKSLSVVSCKADDAAKLKVDCGHSGSISIHAASDIGASSNTVVVGVQDATKSHEREVSGTITLSVIDKPDAPLLSPIAGKPSDGMVSLSWTPGSANGSPITDYEVNWGEGSKSCGAVTTCQVTGLTNGKTYSFKVRAKNEVGWSKESAAVDGMPDKVPDAPGNIKVTGGYHKVDVSWDAPTSTGSKPDSYRVTLSDGQSDTTSGNSLSFDIADGSISDGQSIKAKVQAHNRAGDGVESGFEGDAKPWGDPDAPSVSLNQTDDSHMTVTANAGNTHNAGCSSIAISGAWTGTVSCSGGSHTFLLDDGQYGQDVTVHGKVNASKSGTSPKTGDASAPATYHINEPSNVQIHLEGNDTCMLSWSGNGRHNGFQIDKEKVGSGTTFKRWHVDPWVDCDNHTIAQTLGDQVGPTASANGSNVGYYPKADMRGIGLTWQDHDHITVSGTPTTYNQGWQAKIHIWANGQEHDYDWASSIDVHDLPDSSDYTWQVQVFGSDSRLNNDTGDPNQHHVGSIRRSMQSLRPQASALSLDSDDASVMSMTPSSRKHPRQANAQSNNFNHRQDARPTTKENR